MAVEFIACDTFVQVLAAETLLLHILRASPRVAVRRYDFFLVRLNS